MFSIFKKKSLVSLLAVFSTLVADLRTLAAKKVAEAAKADEAAKEISCVTDAKVNALYAESDRRMATLHAQVEAAELEAEQALAAADQIESTLGIPSL